MTETGAFVIHWYESFVHQRKGSEEIFDKLKERTQNKPRSV